MASIRRLINLLRQSRINGDAAQEIESHIAMRIDENIAGGMSPEEARREAVLRFGNRTVMRERVAAADMSLRFDSAWRDLRYAARHLRRSPGFACTAILTLTPPRAAGRAKPSAQRGVTTPRAFRFRYLRLPAPAVQ